MLYIYTQNPLFRRSIFDRFFDRFFNDFFIAFRSRFKAPLGGLYDIRVGLWHLLEVFFLWQGSSKSSFLLFCVKMKISDFVRTSHAKWPLLLLRTRYRWYPFLQKWWFCKGHPYNFSKHPLCYAFLQKVVDFQFWPPLPCKMVIFFWKSWFFGISWNSGSGQSVTGVVVFNIFYIFPIEIGTL